MNLRVIYLRELSPSVLLAEPGLAPLAVLARGNARERRQAFAAALHLIHDHGGSRTRELLEFAAVLAKIRLDGPTIGRIAKEIGMSVESIATDFEPTEFGQELMARGRAEMLTALLTERFGDHPDLRETAARLARWPGASAVRAVTSAASWEDIPPEPAE